MPNKRISQFPVTTTLAGNDIFLINHLDTTSTVSFNALSASISNSVLAVVGPTVTTNSQTGTSYTITLPDNGRHITFSNSSPITLFVPTNASVLFPIGSQIMISQIGTGQVTVAAVTPGTTSVNGNNGTKTAGQYAIISLIKIATDSWIIGGDATI
jgi:hypothetical protein